MLPTPIRKKTVANLIIGNNMQQWIGISFGGAQSSWSSRPTRFETPTETRYRRKKKNDERKLGKRRGSEGQSFCRSEFEARRLWASSLDDFSWLAGRGGGWLDAPGRLIVYANGGSFASTICIDGNATGLGVAALSHRPHWSTATSFFFNGTCFCLFFFTESCRFFLFEAGSVYCALSSQEGFFFKVEEGLLLWTSPGIESPQRDWPPHCCRRWFSGETAWTRLSFFLLRIFSEFRTRRSVVFLFK